MARYAILQGVGHTNRPFFNDATSTAQDWPEMWRKWSHLVVQGPSGQLAILPPPSGMGNAFLSTGTDETEQGVSKEYNSYESLMCHVPVAWKHNSLLHWWRWGFETSRADVGWRWHPYEHEEAHQNATGPAFDTNNDYDLYTINDGHHNTLHFFGLNDVGNGVGGLAHQDGIFYNNQLNLRPTYGFGNWTGQLPIEVAAGHFFPGKRFFGNPGDFEESHFQFPAQQGVGTSKGRQGWVDYRSSATADPNDETLNICDMVEFDGAYWICTQTMVFAKRIGTKGSFIYADFWDNRQDEFGGESTYGLGNVDTTRGTIQKFDGPKARVFAKHRINNENKLFMLQNDGKIFEVNPGGILKLADLSTDIQASPFGSGITGGSLQKTPLFGVGQWTQPRTMRPYMVSFNNQLHAFLNYSLSTSEFAILTGTPVAKNSDGAGNVLGVGWFTSSDGINWQDRTSMLAGTPAQSGIITPSGNIVQKTIWNNLTSPYIYSGFQNVPYPSGYGGRASFGESSPITGDSAPIDRGDDSVSVLKPSGFRQATGEPKETSSRHQNDVDSGKAHMGGDTDRLPIWTSGNLIDAPGTPFNLLQIKLDMGTVSGYLYPTIVDYPSGYEFINPDQLDGATKPTNLLPEASGGFWGPFGQGARGWDFTGVRNRHVTGYVNDADERTNNHELMLCFSDNPPQTNSLSANQVASHFFTLNKASGWRQVNYAHWGGAFCGGYKPIDIHDPEVIIASGSLDDPNPFVDNLRQEVRIKFKLLDFGFWDQVNMKFEYTLDEGANWHAGTVSGSLGPLGTSTKQSDPSGIIGENHEIYWLYPQDIGGNQFFPMVRIRMRAEVN